MLTRKQFLRSAFDIGAAALGLTVLAGCGGGGGPSPGPGSNPSPGSPDAPPPQAGRCVMNGTNVVIGSNHGHVLVVSKQDVAASTEKTFHIMGTATHDHTVTVTVDMFQQLAADHAIMVTSSVDLSHSHDIMVACA